MKRIAMAASLAVGVLGFAVAPARADKVDNIHLTSKTEVKPQCSYGGIKDFEKYKHTQGEHGLHDTVWISGAESWLACNSNATITTVVETTGPVHAVCGFDINSTYKPLNVDLNSTGTVGECGAKLEAKRELIYKDAKSAGQWYQVHASGKGKTPLPAGTYTWNIYQTAAAK